MKIKLLIAFLSTFLASSLSAAVITGFGNTDFTQTVAFGGDVAGATSYSISNVDNGNALYGSVPSVFIGSVANLYFTATQSTSLTSLFTIEVFDAEGDSIVYNGNWAQFASGVTATAILTRESTNAAFSGTVVSIGLLTGGTGSLLTLNLDTLSSTASAIPESSTYAAIFCAAVLGLVVVRRRFASK